MTPCPHSMSPGPNCCKVCTVEKESSPKSSPVSIICKGLKPGSKAAYQTYYTGNTFTVVRHLGAGVHRLRFVENWYNTCPG